MSMKNNGDKNETTTTKPETNIQLLRAY